MTDQTHHTATISADPTARSAPLEPHRLDVAALLFGLMFLAIGSGAVADELGWLSITGRAWGGALLVTIGVASVVSLVARLIRSSGEPEDARRSVHEPS